MTWYDHVDGILDPLVGRKRSSGRFDPADCISYINEYVCYLTSLTLKHFSSVTMPEVINPMAVVVSYQYFHQKRHPRSSIGQLAEPSLTATTLHICSGELTYKQFYDSQIMSQPKHIYHYQLYYRSLPRFGSGCDVCGPHLRRDKN